MDLVRQPNSIAMTCLVFHSTHLFLCCTVKFLQGSGAPCQRFVGGSLQLWQSGLTALDFFDRVTDEYGVDEEGFEVEEDAT